MYLHAMNSCVFSLNMWNILKHSALFDVSKWRSEICWLKIWLGTSSGTFEANTKRCARSVVWTRRGVCWEKEHMKFFGGIRSLHWKCSNLRHCRVFYGFWLIEGKNNVNRNPWVDTLMARWFIDGKNWTFAVWPRFHDFKAMEEEGEVDLKEFREEAAKDWKKTESWTHAKKRSLKILKSIWTCFPWSFTGFLGLTFWHLKVRCLVKLSRNAQPKRR